MRARRMRDVDVIASKSVGAVYAKNEAMLHRLPCALAPHMHIVPESVQTVVCGQCMLVSQG